MNYSKLLYQGWNKAPELLAIRFVQMFTRQCKPEHLQITEQLIEDIMAICPDIPQLCSALSKTILDQAKEPE